jgi:anaerobic magnesium-protoporphyrin IX monomethyl ester cyclase
MRILVFQFAPATRRRVVPRFEPQLGTLLALLRSRGHELGLVGCSTFDLGVTKAALARHLPQLIYADIAGVCVHAARRTLEYITQHEFLPIVVGGIYPTIDPAKSLSLPGVTACAIGEPDATLVTYLERIKDPTATGVTSGVWLRDERGTAQPALPDLVEDLDSLPFPERELFGTGEFVHQTQSLEVSVGRGCPQRCNYCVNATVAAKYGAPGEWVRRRSPDNILDEIDTLRERYQPIRLVRFLDHAFALDRDWLDEFLGVYVRRCALPFRCHLRLNAAEEQTVTLLREAGCEIVDLEVISSSFFIRNEIFDMDLTNPQIESAFERLHAAGIQTRAVVYLGSPYDSEAALNDTRVLLRELKPTCVDVRPYYPFPGTGALLTSEENGWIHPRGEQQFHSEQTGIDMPACRPDLVAAFIRRLCKEFPTGTATPWWQRWSNVPRSAITHLWPRRR